MMIEANNDDEVKGDRGESIQMVEVCDDDEARVLRRLVMTLNNG